MAMVGRWAAPQYLQTACRPSSEYACLRSATKRPNLDRLVEFRRFEVAIPMPDLGVRAWAAHDKAVLPGLDIAIAATACDAHRLGEQHARTECHDGVELTPIHEKSVRAAYRPGLSAAVPFQALA